MLDKASGTAFMSRFPTHLHSKTPMWQLWAQDLHLDTIRLYDSLQACQLSLESGHLPVAHSVCVQTYEGVPGPAMQTPHQCVGRPELSPQPVHLSIDHFDLLRKQAPQFCTTSVPRTNCSKLSPDERPLPSGGSSCTADIRASHHALLMFLPPLYSSVKVGRERIYESGCSWSTSTPATEERHCLPDLEERGSPDF